MRGIIAIVDALGISTFNLEQSLRFVAARDKIISQIQKISKETAKKLSTENLHPNFHTIGDTVVISWKAKDDASDIVAGLIWTGTWLRYLLVLGLHERLLFRGTMSYGEYIAQENTILGPAVADAASWYQFGDWFGITCVPSLQFLLNKIELHEEADDKIILPPVYLKYDVPMKTGERKSLWTIPWPFDIWHHLKAKLEDSKAIETESKKWLHSMLDDLPVPKGTEDKYTNSLGYFHHCLQTFAKEQREMIEMDLFTRMPSLSPKLHV